MKRSERSVWVFIALVLLVMLIIEKCQRGKDNPPGAVSIVTKKTIDTIPGTSKINIVPFPYAVRDSILITDTVTKYIERAEYLLTIQMLNESVKELQRKLDACNIPYSHYLDTIKLDTLGEVYLRESAQGLIKDRSWSWRLFIPTTTVKQTIAEKRRLKLFLGLEYMYPINYIGAGAMMQLKNDNILKLGYGYGGSRPQYSAGYYFKIKLKK